MCGNYELDYSPKSKLSLQGMTVTGYQRGIELIRMFED